MEPRQTTANDKRQRRRILTIDEDGGRVNLFKLLVQLLQTDMDIPDQMQR